MLSQTQIHKSYAALFLLESLQLADGLLGLKEVHSMQEMLDLDRVFMDEEIHNLAIVDSLGEVSLLPSNKKTVVDIRSPAGLGAQYDGNVFPYHKEPRTPRHITR